MSISQTFPTPAFTGGALSTPKAAGDNTATLTVNDILTHLNAISATLYGVETCLGVAQPSGADAAKAVPCGLLGYLDEVRRVACDVRARLDFVAKVLGA